MAITLKNNNDVNYVVSTDGTEYRLQNGDLGYLQVKEDDKYKDDRESEGYVVYFKNADGQNVYKSIGVGPYTIKEIMIKSKVAYNIGRANIL